MRALSLLAALLCAPLLAVPDGAGEEPIEAGAAGAEAAAGDPAEAADAEDGASIEAPEPWQPPREAERFRDGVPLVGPWPDGWSAPSGPEGLDLIDPLTGAVLRGGIPAVEGALEGPAPPEERAVERGAEADEPSDGEDAGGEGSAADEGSALDEDSDGGEDSAADEGSDGGEGSAADEGSAVGAPPPGGDLGELLPRLQGSPHHGLGFILLAIGVGLLSIVAERLRGRLPAGGLLPAALRLSSGFGRLLTVLLLLLALVSSATGAWQQVVPFVLIGAGIALGWSARDAIRDVLAGAVLLVEAPLEPGDRVRCGEVEGMVVGLGPRAVLLANDRGQSVSVPNRMFLEAAIAVDSNPYAPVEVSLHVPEGVSAEQIHQTLTELALLSPYLAPTVPPQVYRDPDDSDVWIVEARLVSPLYRREFRGAMVELSEEALGRPCEPGA